MISVKADREFLQKSLFEFLRIKFPDYVNHKEIKLTVDNVKNNWRVFLIKDELSFDISFYFESEREVHYEIKRRLFDYFVEQDLFFDKSYGILSGVRPSKLASKIFSKNSLEDSIKILKDKYRVPESDSRFLYKIYKKQNNIKSPFSKDNYNIYVNIPFCPSRCSYCSFDTAIYNKNLAKDYVDALLNEIKSYERKSNKAPHSIYIGGGTPSSLEVYELNKIIKLLLDKFGKAYEFTVECGRIDTLSVELLEMLRSNGVNRISLNPQSFNEEVIKNLNRNSNADFKKWFDIAREIGFRVINMDLILGLPGEDNESIISSIKKAIEIGPENITLHTLALKNGSKLFEYGYENKNDYDSLLKDTKILMEENLYEPYYMYRQKKTVMNSENIGYSRTGTQSIYNIAMMEEIENIIGFGSGASSKVLSDAGRFKRDINTKNLKEYINKRR
ncbi:coproporphyrinogen dehydrogenase HemZ [Peptoniphilus sp.]|jgi:coproporphyrinogen dehydrogenase HemZ|uniref:coproporphyrinogen dehydrogenase HemZ n=1 Tax=Peptoniphilus sp. TaxID=1971214 RepID=UPI003D8FF292